MFSVASKCMQVDSRSSLEAPSFPAKYSKAVGNVSRLCEKGDSIELANANVGKHGCKVSRSRFQV
jgi:hypothetical protein